MRTRIVLATAPLGLLAASSTANAGGVGVMGTAGLHEARAFFYREDGEQGIDYQNRPNAGIGVEALLGDRDDRILGLARLYYLSDWPVNEPDLGKGADNPEAYTYPAAHLEPNHNVGVLSVGLQFGVWGDPAGFQVVATGLFGSGFATKDNLEFFMVEPGAGVTYTWSDRFQAYGNLAATARYRKHLYLGENAYAGVRYMFD